MGWVLVHVQDDAVTVVVTRNSVCVYICICKYICRPGYACYLNRPVGVEMGVEARPETQEVTE